MDPDFRENAWKIINEFLSLQYSSGSVSVGVKEKLIKVLTKEVQSKLNRKKPFELILKSLLITLKSNGMQNYYKSRIDEYAKYVATCLNYLSIIIRNKNDLATEKSVSSNEIREYFDVILSTLKNFLKHTPYIDDFKNEFITEILNNLCEIVILLKSMKIDYTNDLITLLQELFFDGNRTNELTSFLTKPTEVTNEYRKLFETPIHVTMILIETILISYRNDNDVKKDFIKFLLNNENGKFRCIAADRDDRILLRCQSLFIHLMRKHDVPLNFDIEKTKCILYLGKCIENAVNEQYTYYVYETLCVVCATLKLNPMILEHSACQIAVKFMLLAKTEETIWRKYEEMMSLLIEMYRKLSRAEKFISQLLKHLHETLSSMKLSKKLKRSFNASFTTDTVAIHSPRKRNKNSVSEELEIDLSNVSLIGDSVDYLELIYNNFGESNDSVVSDNNERNVTTNYNDILFAFPPSFSRNYTRFISGLVSKPSLVVWKTLIFTLKDYVAQLNSADGKSTENSMFLIEITSALLSQYFAGNRLTEQADKSWKSIDENRQLTFNVLHEFGQTILNQEHNHRTMNAFLKLCFNASNFDLIYWYYCPDSMNPLNSAAQHSDLPKLDGLKCIKELYSYLSDKEWTIIEQRITNFGKRECKWNFNKISMQRTKATQLFDENKNADVTKNLLSSTLQDAEQIYCILSDAITANWFIDNLKQNQLQLICELLLRSPQDLTQLHTIQFTNRRFIDTLIVSTYKSIIQIFSECKIGDYLKNIDWTTYLSLNNVEILPNLIALLENTLKSKRRNEEKLLETSQDDLMAYLQLIVSLPIGYAPRHVKNMIFVFNSAIQWMVLKSKNHDINAQLLRVYKSKY